MTFTIQQHQQLCFGFLCFSTLLEVMAIEIMWKIHWSNLIFWFNLIADIFCSLAFPQTSAFNINKLSGSFLSDLIAVLSRKAETLVTWQQANERWKMKEARQELLQNAAKPRKHWGKTLPLALPFLTVLWRLIGALTTFCPWCDEGIEPLPHAPQPCCCRCQAMGCSESATSYRQMLYSLVGHCPPQAHFLMFSPENCAVPEWGCSPVESYQNNKWTASCRWKHSTQTSKKWVIMD